MMQVDLETQEKIDLIRNVLQEAICSVRRIEDGAHCYVLEINRRWIFRFSTSSISQSRLVKEISFLRRFVSHSPLPIPDYKLIGTGFVGYRKLHGHPLNREILSSYDKSCRAGIARSIANFLRKLNTFPIDMDTKPERSDSVDFNGQVWPAVAEHLSGKSRSNAREYFSNNSAFIEYTPAAHLSSFERNCSV